MREYHFKKRREVRRLVCQLALRDALPSYGIDDGKIRLCVTCPEFEEKFQDLLFGTRGVGRGLVYFVDDHDWFEPQLKRFLQYKARLRHRTLLGIHDQEDGVDTAEHPLHLRTEVRVAGGIDDIYLGVPIENGRILRIDGNPALELERVRVHRHALLGDARLPQKRIGKRGLPVVDVSYNCNISNFHSKNDVIGAFLRCRFRCSLTVLSYSSVRILIRASNCIQFHDFSD